MKRNFLLLLGFVALFALSVAAWYYGFKRPNDIKSIGTYAECIKRYPVQTLIYPPQCATPDGRTFVDPSATIPTLPTDIDGLANPASAYCEEQGGKLEIISEEPENAPGGGGGQVGMCTLPNGNVCEEWAFFKGECN